MPEEIRLAKGEDLDALEDIVNNHIGSDETHVTAGDKQNWNGKADVAMLETEGYLKKKKSCRRTAVNVCWIWFFRRCFKNSML